jgi:serine/threonine-protein phosphatase 2A activator
MRRLILTYTLEPAGSHGVWGLDDHSFLPYIFGSAQLGPAISPSSPIPTEGSLPGSPSPASVANKDIVADYASTNMYFSAIQFIHDVKRGPFWEHSPVLYDISGIKDGWGKINKGMLKMWNAECLGKFPVVQHFCFGSLWRWERDPDAPEDGPTSSVHASQQPKANLVSKDGPPPPPPASATGTGSVGTAAPWARPVWGQMPALPQMQASTGMPTTRGPWTNTGAGGVGGRASPASSTTTAQRRPPPPTTDMNATAAPWAKKAP